MRNLPEGLAFNLVIPFFWLLTHPKVGCGGSALSEIMSQAEVRTVSDPKLSLAVNLGGRAVGCSLY